LRVDFKWVGHFLARQFGIIPGFHGTVRPRILGTAVPDVSEGGLAGGLGDGAVGDGAKDAACVGVNGAGIIFGAVAF